MRLVLDTSVILYHLADRLSAPLPQATISASIISEMETRSYPELSVRDEAVIQRYLACLHLVELTPAIKEKSIFLRRQHRLKLPDAIIAATAQELGAVPLTCDRQLLNVLGVGAQAPEVRP